jgi:hypothetical protein
MTAVGSICEFDFLAVRPRRTENAASAKSSALPRGRKTGHSFKTQQYQSSELTDCGHFCRSRRFNDCLHFVVLYAELQSASIALSDPASQEPY